jgi:endoglucanase
MKKFPAFILPLFLSLMIPFISCGTSFKPFPQTDTGQKIWMMTGVNQLENGDFSRQGKNWNFYLSGGNASVQYGAKKAAITLSSTGTVNYGVQFYYDGFRLYQGGKYTFSFTAAASSPKGCEVRIQYNGGDYHAYAIDTFTLTSDPRTYTLDFEMNEASDPAPRLAFNMGAFPDRDKEKMPVEVTIQDVSLKLNNAISAKEESNGGADIVRVNQIGYRTNDKKTAFVKVQKDGLQFSVLDKNGTEVFSGKLGRPVRDEMAFEYTAPADFSSVTEPGTYTVKVGSDESFPFVISDSVYTPILTDVLSYFTLSRCGTEVTGSLFGHPACHLGQARIFGTNDYMEADGGWHDAGDYGRYVVPAAKTVADLLSANQAASKTYRNFSILGETQWELDWMLKMQRADGGVYHKITCKKFPPFVMPQMETEQLIVSPVSTAATADFAASTALAAVYYRSSNPQFANTALAAAERAWNYLEQNSFQSFSNPSTVETGAYADTSDTDERYFAAAALCKATGNTKYAAAAEKLRKSPHAESWKEEYGWAQMEGYGNEIIINNPDLFSPWLVKEVKGAVLKRANTLIAQAANSGFGLAIKKTVWGSNMEVLNDAHLLAFAYDITGRKRYIGAAYAQVNYVLGCNPMTECYVTGYGMHSPQHPHHRPSIAMNTPMKGMLVGGPNEKLEDAFAQNLLTGKPPLLCYADNYQCFSTNEVAIYWNSALVYALAKLYYAR